ncbi:response regulator [Geotalea uraniireducens]|uniref:histidine kinase n=1 Tax=Geotalea uraniireducens (strain Rf4) TaxID=351605 RepID=A5GDW1_GEOUR|nr:response regulator [Geotalea uraniireducens]ABQ24227.1 PAS/PAC sensor hybrid histidine kinase [Geotalea uraniireducens Rf4]
MEKDKILIVDDEPDIALILKLQLEDAGYKTATARDGVEALAAIAREKFALVLLDIKMPRMDGMQVLERVQSHYSDVAVVMMTAHGSEDIAVEAMKNGAFDYIAKPFSSEDVLQKVKRAIQLNTARQENIRLQRQLDEERQKMEAILQGMADLLLAVDDQGRIITSNRKAEEVLGLKREELLGMPVEEALKADIPSEELPSRVVLRTTQPSLDVTYTMLCGSANIPVSSSAAPLTNASGQLIGSVEIIRDISRLKALEQEKEDFVSMLSHDLKAPITAVVGSVDLVREGRLGPVNADQREYLESSMESCAEMVEMIDTLLGVHKFEAGKMLLHFKEEAPHQLIQRTLTRYITVAKRAQIHLFATVDENLPTISADRATFSRLLGNLISNALKFTPEGGEIEVSAAAIEDISAIKDRIPRQSYPVEKLSGGDRFLQITVRDSGVGIPPEALEGIFDRFVQAKNRRLGKSSGTGLGLTFCRKVMDAHKGYIWAESVVGQGSSFVMLFPITE